MKISIKYVGSIINLPSSVVDYIKDATERDVKVILGLNSFCAHFNDFDSALPSFCQKLGLELNEVLRALEFWHSVGVLDVDALSVSCDTASDISARQNAMPNYTGEQISNLVKSTPDFEMLASCAQNVLEKDFTPTDFSSLLQIKSFYKFSDDYILMLLAYCHEIEKDNWSYIRKTVKNLYDDGVDTYEKLEAHFAQRRNKRSVEYKVRKLFGIGMREFTKREKAIFDSWVELKISFDLIKCAYEISVNNDKGANWSYINKILENWKSSGVKTVDDAEALIKNNKSRLSGSSFDTDDFFEAALKRSSERIKERSKK